jgi:hypothetical protein
MIMALLSLTCLSAADAIGGRYTGTWTSENSGNGGGIKMDLKTGADAVQNSEVSFTISNYEIKTKMKSIRPEGSGLEVQYEFDLQGNKLTSTLTLTVSGDKLEGKYVSRNTGGDQVDAGSIKALLVK